MPKTLSDTAQVILAAAAARDDLHILPLPTSIRAPAAAVTRIIKGFVANGLAKEVAAKRDDAVWRQTDAEGKITLVMTNAGLQAIGIEPSPTSRRKKGPKAATRGRTAAKSATRGTSRRKAKKAPREGDTKQATVIALLRRGNGASIEEMMAATGWQAHSVRGFMSGALKKRLKLDVVSEKDAKTGERRYYVAAMNSRKSAVSAQ